MPAAGIVVHHTVKPPRRGTAKRSAETTMYSPHGSAEWTNGPRGGITIEATNSPTVYEFVIGKRGDKSGWEPDENGNYIRYFSQAVKGLPMQWFPSTEEEIAVVTQDVSLTDQDVLSLFTASQPELIRSETSASLSAEGFMELSGTRIRVGAIKTTRSLILIKYVIGIRGQHTKRTIEYVKPHTAP